MKKGFYRMLAGLSEVTELPLTEMCREFSVSISGRREITVDGVLSVKKYESCCITLEVCGDRICIIGQSLELKNFYHTTLCIGGRIDRIEFSEEKDNELHT